MPFFIGFAAGALMGTACIYFTLLRRPAPPPFPEVPRVKTRLTNRERTIEL
jgi:hypothetical protein